MNIEVSTGARLHFGLISGTPQSGWQYGGVGVMVREPSWRLSVQQCSSGIDLVHASNEAVERITGFLQQIRVHLPLGSVRIHARQEVPFHAGLGSGTQLGLALASIAELLVSGRAPSESHRLASITGRSERSAVGTYGFLHGGFLVDHGKVDDDQGNRVVDRFAFPESWRFVLVRPVGSQGLSGARERNFFEKKCRMSEVLVKELSDFISQKIVPAILSEDFELFATSLAEYGTMVGMFFANEQGGVFSHTAMRELANRLNASGIQGLVQSSWGPGICVPANSLSHARAIMDSVPPDIDGARVVAGISEAMNVGASILSDCPEATGGRFA